MDMGLARVAGQMPLIVDAATDLLRWLPRTPARALPATLEFEAAALTIRGYARLWLDRGDEAERDLRAGHAVASDLGLERTRCRCIASSASRTAARRRSAHATSVFSDEVTRASVAGLIVSRPGHPRGRSPGDPASVKVMSHPSPLGARMTRRAPRSG